MVGVIIRLPSFVNINMVFLLYFCIWSKACVSFSASWFQSSQREICSSHVTTCTSKDILTSGKTSHVGDATVIVRAKTSYWEASSDPYQFNPFHIREWQVVLYEIYINNDFLSTFLHLDVLSWLYPPVKMTRPKIDVTAFSNYLLVDWTRSHASIKCHCQVKCSKVWSAVSPCYRHSKQ